MKVLVGFSIIFLLIFEASCGREVHDKRSKSNSDIYFAQVEGMPGACLETKADSKDIIKNANKGSCPASSEVDSKSTEQFIKCPFSLENKAVTAIFYKNIVVDGKTIDLTTMDRDSVCNSFTRSISESEKDSSLL